MDMPTCACSCASDERLYDSLRFKLLTRGRCVISCSPSSKLSPATHAKLKAKALSSLGAMPKSGIESWVASTSSVSDDRDNELNPSGWRRELVLSDWDQAMKIAQRKLYTSSTKSRIQFLQEELLPLAKSDGGLLLNDDQAVVLTTE
ncbi:hypothetical protein EIP86_010059 [Pleurotus ostreatoroseus]|nr:hypothetical protein EIP86_010059 [Pleurotus ostreatoroseus]